jgi:hypothetical protein
VERLTRNDLLKIQMEKMYQLGISRKDVADMPSWAYLASKAATYLVTGKKFYQKDDFFHYPLDEWDEEKLKSSCESIIYNCTGMMPDSCFTDLTIEELKNLFEFFHFDFEKIEIINEDRDLYVMSFVHKMDGQGLHVYCQNEASRL